MEIFNKVLNAMGLERKGSSNPTANAILSGFGFSTGKKISAARAMTAYTGWTYAAVRAIAEEVGKIQFKLYKENSKGEAEEVTSHELLDLLSAGNPYQTSFEVMFAVASHLELAGNSYLLLDGVESEGGKPKNLYVLSPKDVKVLKAPLPEFIKGYKYVFEGQETDYKPYQILHFKYPDPNDPYEGIGTVQAIASWIDADNSAMNVNTSYFKNGARLSGLLSTEAAITETQQKMLQASFEKLYKGEDNAYKVAILPKGMKYDELSATPKDMDFANLADQMQKKILSGFRVPKTLLGGSESETNRATAEAARLVFLANVIKPKMEMICQYLNEFLVPRYGEGLYLTFENPVTDDKTQMLEEVRVALGGQPSMSVNEVRGNYFGLPPIENGDEVMTTFNLIPLGEPKEVAKTVNRETVKVLKPSVKNARKFNKRKEMAEDIADRVAKGIATTVSKHKEIKSKGLAAFKDMDEEQEEVLHKAFLTRVTPYEKLMREAVRKFNKKQKNDVIDGLQAAKKAGLKAELFDLEKYIGLLADLATPILTDLFEKEGKAASELVSAPPLEITDNVRNAIAKGIRLMSTSYNEETLRQLQAVLEEGQQAGWSLDELTSKVEDIYELSDGYRAERVAKTETFRTANDSNKEAWKQSGVVKTIKWHTAADERTCEFCGPLHGKVIDIDENFFDKGDSLTGREGGKLPLDYADVGAPPLHVNCRCYSRPEDVSID